MTALLMRETMKYSSELFKVVLKSEAMNRCADFTFNYLF
jgi:hypothetical protein